MSRVRAYAGYLEVDEKLFPFCFMVNNYTGSSSAIRKGIGKFLLEIVESLSRHWCVRNNLSVNNFYKFDDMTTMLIMPRDQQEVELVTRMMEKWESVQR